MASTSSPAVPVGRFVLLLPVGMRNYTVSLEISTSEPTSYPGGCKEMLRAVERVLKDGTRGYWDGHVSSRCHVSSHQECDT